jgi:hypothetical protein
VIHDRQRVPLSLSLPDPSISPDDNVVEALEKVAGLPRPLKKFISYGGRGPGQVGPSRTVGSTLASEAQLLGSMGVTPKLERHQFGRIAAEQIARARKQEGISGAFQEWLLKRDIAKARRTGRY